MNHREPPHLPVDSCRALQFVALLLMPALAPTHTHATGRLGAADSAPYLLAVGAPMLRFREALPPPNLTKRSPAGAPPVPNGEVSALTVPPNRPDVLLAPPSATSAAAGDPTKPASQPSNPQPTPAAIIPDDTRPNVRPEDFLPFFQIPGSASAPVGVNVIAPVPQSAPTPATIPVSSATYTQTPR
ncbi:MAG: hypothetical protein H7343_15495 [Undibacterium sp.]|nr:hypothetical protein [Opitutaceae bacterium]